jgi:hypothetical protein
VPKSWLSMDDLHETDMEDELDEELFLSEHMNATRGMKELSVQRFTTSLGQSFSRLR